MLPKKLSEYRSPLVLVMGILFFATGLGLVLYTPFKFYQRSILLDAEQVPATILELEQKTEYRRGTTITGKYRYHFRGQNYESTRLAIFGETESLYQDLLSAKKEQRQATCFVDPTNPDFSAIDLEWRVKPILLANLLGPPFLYFGGVYLYRHFKWKFR